MHHRHFHLLRRVRGTSACRSAPCDAPGQDGGPARPCARTRRNGEQQRPGDVRPEPSSERWPPRR